MSNNFGCKHALSSRIFPTALLFIFLAAPDAVPELEVKYPDAAFALMISENLFAGDREQNEIHQKAFKSILEGEPIVGVRFRYDYDLETYLERHMWDD